MKAEPDLADEHPFKTVLSGDREAMARLTMEDLLAIASATLTGMDVDVFEDDVRQWIGGARDPRWKRPFTDLVYQPQIELLNYLWAYAFTTYIVTGGGQDFVRAYAERVYRNSAGAGGRLGRRSEICVRRRRQARTHQGAEAAPQR